MSHIIHRNLQSIPKLAENAEGVYIFDKTGKSYLDASSGAAVSCLGHKNAEVIAALHSQIDKLAYAHTSFFTNECAEQLASLLVDKAPKGLEHVYFVSGGSEAIETALKLARQYFVEIGQPQRTRFIARKQSYHGNTLGALAVGGNIYRRKQFAPILMDVIHVSPCYAYRGCLEYETIEEYTQRLLTELEDTIIKEGPETIIAFCAETVVGSTLGAVPPTPNYLRGIKAICDKYGILYIADEVMCGIGRTGSYFAFEQDNVIPDIVTVAKGLGGGYQPIGAVIAKDEIIAAIKQGSGSFQHGHTYICHPVAAAAGLAVQNIIFRDHLIESVKEKGWRLQNKLIQTLSNNKYVGDIRGRGLFIGIELVRDKQSKQPFSPQDKLFSKIKSHCLDKGLMTYPMGGTIDGLNGDHILLAPPFIINDKHIDIIVNVLKEVIEEETQNLRQ